MDKYLILDTETTGLNFNNNDEIVEIAIIDQDEKILLNTLIKPIQKIPHNVIEIHGINNKLVEDAPSFIDIYPNLKKILKDRTVFIYNADFDNSIIKTCCYLNKLQKIKYSSECVMLDFSNNVYKEHSDYFNSYKWQKLTTAYKYYYPNDDFYLLNSSHRALADCLMTSKVLKKMRGIA